MTRRHLPWLLLAIGACSTRDKSNGLGFNGAGDGGTDAIVVRISKNGGPVRAYQFPRLDSMLWKSAESAPAIATILSFDRENGQLAYVDRKGQPGWFDLFAGRAVTATHAPLTDIASNDGWSIYGIRRDSSVDRLTPTGEWSIKLRGQIHGVYPLPDGSLVLAVNRGAESRLLRMRPPETTVIDSATIPEPEQAAVGPLGDRLFFAAKRDLYVVGGAALARMKHVRMREDVIALVPSPSGDRVYVATKGRRELDVVDRFTNERATAVRLPALPHDLRMDPLGRFLLAHQQGSDSAWVVDVGNNRLVASIATEWRADLPAVASDGSVATVRGRDVTFIVPGDRGPRIIVKEGALDVWQLLYWNGFRPRAKGLDQPVVFAEESTAVPAPAAPDSTPTVRPPRPDTVIPKPRPVAPIDTTPRLPPPATNQWTVSFAAVLSETRAREVADEIVVDGRHPRVVVSVMEGVRVNRVVLGPYPTRADAERVGKVSGHSFWVFAGPP